MRWTVSALFDFSMFFRLTVAIRSFAAFCANGRGCAGKVATGYFSAKRPERYFIFGSDWSGLACKLP
jgi:hypothetical protein